MPRWPSLVGGSRLLAVVVCLLAVILLVWSAKASGIMLLFRSGPSDDAAGLRGRTLALAGEDAFHPGHRIALAELPAPVLVCRMEVRTGHWVPAALKRAFAKLGKTPTLLAVLTTGDAQKPEWVLASGMPFHGVLADSETMVAWGFRPDVPEIRLVGTDGKVLSANLAGDDRDDTIVKVQQALAE